MVDEKLLELNKILSKGDFFKFLGKLDVDNALDKRDEEPFDRYWMDSYNTVNEVNKSIPHEDLEFINSIREMVFKSSYAVLKNSELSSYISDDIELIAKSIVLNFIDNYFLKYLLDSYMHGFFPFDVDGYEEK